MFCRSRVGRGAAWLFLIFFVNSRQKEKRKANILRTVFLAQGALWLPNEASRMGRTRTDREDLFRDRSYFKHPRRDRQAFCENRVGFGVGCVCSAGEPPKKTKEKRAEATGTRLWSLITGNGEPFTSRRSSKSAYTDIGELSTKENRAPFRLTRVDTLIRRIWLTAKNSIRGSGQVCQRQKKKGDSN